MKTPDSPSLPYLDELLRRYPQLTQLRTELIQAYYLLEHCFQSGGRLLVCGNGGSAADAEHIVGELMKGYLKPRPLPTALRATLLEHDPEHGAYLADHLQGALPAVALTGHTALSSAFANDVAADMVFAQQLFGYGQAGDLLLAISTSGNSANVVNAARLAPVLKIKTIALTGAGGGQLAQLSSLSLSVPERSTPRVQELHLPVYHWLCEALEERFFGTTP